MEVMYESKSSGMSKFPRIQYFLLYFEFGQERKKGIFFKKLLGKYLTLFFILNLVRGE